MENYRPCILWNDINFPDFHKKERLYEVFAHFYSKICPGHGIINDRWKVDGFNGDFKTPEYRTLEQVSWAEPWESNRGIGYSFGFNRNEGLVHVLYSRWLIRHIELDSAMGLGVTVIVKSKSSFRVRP